MAANANIVISAVDNASRVLNGVGKAAGSMGGALSKSLSVASDLTIVTAGMVRAMQSLGRAISVPLQLSIEQERVERQLGAVLKSTSQAAGLNAKQLKEMASSLQEVTTFGDEAIIGAENILLTFTNIGGAGGIFERTTETVLDMATALGTDLKDQSIQVGKALNDPVKGISALTRVGVTFTDAQKDVIAKLAETGDVAGAQTIILDELQKEFGGSAKAAAETFGGALTQLQNTWGDLLETAGSFIIQNEGVKALIHELSAGVREWTEDIEGLSASQEGQLQIAEVMRSVMVGVLDVTQALVVGFGFLGEQIFNVVKSTQWLTGATIPLTKEQKAAAAEVRRLEEEFNSLGGATEYQRVAMLNLTGDANKARKAIMSKASELNNAKIAYEAATKAAGDFSRITDPIVKHMEGVKEGLMGVDLGAIQVQKAFEGLSEGISSIAGEFNFLDGKADDVKDLSRAVDGLADSADAATSAMEGLGGPSTAQAMQIQRERVIDLIGEMRSAPSAFDAWSASWANLRLELVGLPWEEQTARLKAFADTLEAQARFAKEFKPLNAEEIDQGVEALDSGTESVELLGEELDANNDRMREFAEEIARADEAWQRSIESMANRSADSFSEIFQDWSTGQESLGEGFKDFGAKAKDTLADAFISPILGAEGPLQQLFEGALKPVSNLGKAIGEKIFGTMISGLLGYFGKKKAAEAADAAATVGTQTAASAGIVGVQQASVAAMLPGLSAAASAALVATFGGAAAAAGLLPGVLATAAASGKATATAMAAVPFAEGGYVTEPTYAVAGEAGTELILPLTKPQRARELLDELPGRAPGLLAGGKTIVNNVTVEINMSGSSATPEAVAEVVNEVLGAKLGLT